MRDIKFRAWDRANNIWLDPDLFIICPDNGRVIEIDYDDNNGNLVLDKVNHNVILEQYTGTKDAEDVPICEGDIVVPYKSQELSERQTIIFDRFGFSQHSEIVGNTLLGMLNYELIVIGNIHEQPELLEDM